MSKDTRILIIGAGLIGTSFALAMRQAVPNVVIDAIEQNAMYRDQVDRLGVFRAVYPNHQQVVERYDLAVLAIPPHAAEDALEWTSTRAQVVMDVCSVKRGICERAQHIGLDDGFVPSHPMAGKASGGPGEADASLFVDRPWIFLRSVPPSSSLVAAIRKIGARPLFVEDEFAHDEMVAFVSHGIHVTSLSAMLAADKLQDSAGQDLAPFAGPALWDITRLAASPIDFWRDTLISNNVHVLDYIQGLQKQLSLFERALTLGEPGDVTALLQRAQEARRRWEERRI